MKNGRYEEHNRVVWYKDGQRHRNNDLPAVEMSDGSKLWYQNGNFHRNDGPAIEFYDGSNYWYKDGQRHRETGPAYISRSGTERWYIDGEEITSLVLNRDNWRNWTKSDLAQFKFKFL